MPEVVKQTKGKCRMDLIPVAAMKALGDVFTWGATKYPERNYEHGYPEHELYGATLRHLIADRSGERLDPESGLPHLWHAMANLAMWVDNLERLYELAKANQRPKPVVTATGAKLVSPIALDTEGPVTLAVVPPGTIRYCEAVGTADHAVIRRRTDIDEFDTTTMTIDKQSSD